MKKLVLLSCIVSTIIQAQVPNILGECKIGAMVPLAHTTQKIYGDALPFVAVEFDCQWREQLSLWLLVGAAHKKGESVGLCYRTDLTVVPIGFGLRYTSDFTDTIHPYIGLGPQITHLSVHDHSLYTNAKNNKWLYGGLLKSGLFIELNEVLFADIFADFSFIKTSGRSCSNPVVYCNNASLNSLLIGVGLGVSFN